MTLNKRSFEFFNSSHECLILRVFFFKLVFFHNDFSNYKNWIFKKKWIVKIISFFSVREVCQKFRLWIFDFWSSRIDAINFVIIRLIWLEQYQHIYWFKYLYCWDFFFINVFIDVSFFRFFFIFRPVVHHNIIDQDCFQIKVLWLEFNCYDSVRLLIITARSATVSKSDQSKLTNF